MEIPVYIESINDKNIIERLYSLGDIMISKGWHVYVSDYEE